MVDWTLISRLNIAIPGGEPEEGPIRINLDFVINLSEVDPKIQLIAWVVTF